MKLQILISHYKEPEEIMARLLNSIKYQQDINFQDIGIIITNDGTECLLSENFLKQFNLSIQYYKIKKRGLTASRQNSFDKAEAEYIMWCDADDEFASPKALAFILKAIENPCDIFIPPFYAEAPDGSLKLIEHDGTFIHGKVYNRQFIIDHNIKWKHFRVNEDAYFNSMCLIYAEKVLATNIPFYIWKYNEGSVSRSSKNFQVESYVSMNMISQLLIEESIKARKPNNFIVKFPLAELYTYYMLSRTETFYTADDYAMREFIFADFVKKYKDLIKTFTYEEMKPYFDLNQARHGNAITDEKDFFDWIKKICE